MAAQKIVILGTGGTIAGQAASPADNIGYTAAQLGIEQLLMAIPTIASMGPVVSEQIAQIDSKDMSFGVWAQLLRLTDPKICLTRFASPESRPGRASSLFALA